MFTFVRARTFTVCSLRDDGGRVLRKGFFVVGFGGSDSINICI